MIIVLVIISLLLFAIVVGCPLLVTLCYDYLLISIDSGSMISFLGSYVGAIITGLISIFCILVSVYFARNQSKKEQDLMIRPYFDFMYNTTDKPTFLKKDIGYIAFEFDPEENNNAKHEPEISGLLVLKNVGLGTALHCQFRYEVNDCIRDRRQMLFSNPKTIVGVRTFQPGDEGSITFSILLNFESIPKEKIAKSLKETFLDKYGVECYWQTPDCKKSFASVHSSYNDAFANLLEEYNINYEREFSISRYSYDFKVGNILIEINPFATHNSTWSPFGNAPKDKNYHQDKTKIVIENGYRCINVWDWDNIDKIVSLLLPKEKIYARKCHIKLIDDVSVVDSFLNIYHLQETCKGQLICLGLYFENKLVQLMTFGKPRYNKNYEYELLRLCSDSNYIIVGGAEKLFKYFISNYFPKSIISYCDNSKFSGDVYYRLGMSLSKYGTPSAHWYSPELNKHITDNLLRQQGFDRLLGKDFGSFGKNTDNEELMIFHGFVKIFDCGQSVFEWKNV